MFIPSLLFHFSNSATQPDNLEDPPATKVCRTAADDVSGVSADAVTSVWAHGHMGIFRIPIALPSLPCPGWSVRQTYSLRRIIGSGAVPEHHSIFLRLKQSAVFICVNWIIFKPSLARPGDGLIPKDNSPDLARFLSQLLGTR